MTEASSRGGTTARILHRAAFVALITVMAMTAGCRREAEQPPSPQPIDASHVQITAWIDAESPCQRATIRLLHELEEEAPDRLDVRIIDVATQEGRARLEEHGLDATAIEIDGYTTLAWGEGDSRRIVTFMHPAGFTWTHPDLRAAVEAALQGKLEPADPAEAEGVRLMDISVRGQSIRVGDQGEETGQLVIQDQIVLEITTPRGDLAPGQRVAAAANALSEVLQKPFTPNQLGLKRVDDGVAVMASDRQLLIATPADVGAEDTSPDQLAAQWRLAIRQALIEAALQRPDAAEPEPQPVPAEPQVQNSVEGEDATPANALTNPLLPAE